MPTGLENLDIDISAVPMDKRDSPDFHRRMRELRRDLRDESTVEAFCTHEAGHLIYFRRANVPVECGGPLIYYDERRRELRHGIALVKPRIAGNVDMDSFARGAAAGGVFTRIIAGQDYTGDSGDYELFCLIADNWLTRNPYLRGFLTAESIWKEAQGVVEKEIADLDSPVRAEIPNAKSEIRLRCFGVSN